MVPNRKGLLFCTYLMFTFPTTEMMYLMVSDWNYPAQVCHAPHKQQYNFGPGPHFPKLPQHYSMRVETNMHGEKMSRELEEYRDGTKDLTSVRLTSNGSTVHTIFDVNERFDIYPNGTCRTSRATDYMESLLDNDKKKVKQSIHALFEMSERSTESRTYMGKEMVRGIAVDHWTACLKFPEGSNNYQLDYYFSDEAHITAAGVKQIPVRLVLNGISNGLDTFGGPVPSTSNSFLHLYDFTSFRVGPVANQQVFTVPPGVECTPSLVGKAIPKLPDAFEISVEQTPITDTPIQFRLIYDIKHGLVEMRDLFVAEFIKAKSSLNEFGYLTSISVMDFKHIVKYDVNQITMTCQAFNIEGKDMDLNVDSGLELFQSASIKQKFYYKGQTIFRRMLVDVWTSEYNGLIQEVYFLSNSSQSISNNKLVTDWDKSRLPILVGILLKNNTFISDDQYSRMYMEYSKTLRGFYRELKKAGFMHTNETLKMKDKLNQIVNGVITEYRLNIFHYSPIYTSTDYFSVAECYHENERIDLVVTVVSNSERDIFYNMNEFINSLRRALADQSNLSIIQISDMTFLWSKFLSIYKRRNYFIFTLLGAPPVPNVKQLAIGPARQALNQAIQRGVQFEIQYALFSKVFNVSNKLFEVNDDGFKDLYFELWNKTKDWNRAYRKRNRFFNKYHDPTEEDTVRYSHTAVSGVAVSMMIFGASLCLFVSMFLYRKRHPGQSLIALGLID